MRWMNEVGSGAGGSPVSRRAYLFAVVRPSLVGGGMLAHLTMGVSSCGGAPVACWGWEARPSHDGRIFLRSCVSPLLGVGCSPI